MGFSLRQSIQQKQSIQQRLVISLPPIQWSLLTAYQAGRCGPPPYEPPTFEEDEFTPRFKLEKRRLAEFDGLGHVARMRRVDEANEIFRFAYTRGKDENSGEEKFFYKIPLMRDFNADPDKIKLRISREDYFKATGLLAAVGEMERIARAVPYYGLYKSVVKHLKRYGAKLADAVLVSVDRGGRLPCLILQRALGFASMESLKVDQGGSGDGLDTDKLDDFARRGTLRGKHVLFVDSTVDSGRQINALKKFFEPRQAELGFTGWSLVGSNEHGHDLDHHTNLNWGVNPDETFEDSPELMGIDYDNSRTKVRECPSEASQAIRACLMSVPDGYVYAADGITEQFTHQYSEWKKRRCGRLAEHRKNVKAERVTHRQETKTWRAEQAEAVARDKTERQLECMLASKTWRAILTNESGRYPLEALPDSVPNGQDHTHLNILIVGSGQRDLPEQCAKFVADNLGPHCSFLAGTSEGNPGAVLKATLASAKVANPEVRLYQPGYSEGRTDDMYGGVPVKFADGDKDEMRRQMIADSHAVLALGGGVGTLREVILALEAGKPTLLVKGYGAVATYLLRHKRLAKRPNLIACSNLAQAVEKALALSAA
ncbi:MAG: hypothetical protein WC641_02845 [Patescibacteria group bacterium]